MKFLTEAFVASRSVTMWDAINKIEDEEVRAMAAEATKERIQEMKDNLRNQKLLEDDDFLSTLVSIAEPVIDKYFDKEDEAEEFSQNLIKFKKLLEQ